MHPELFTIPIVGVSVKTYGFCLMVGFLTAVWFSMRRAQRVKADPDIVLDIAFLSLLFGVGGARVFYVVHYWQSQFAGRENKFIAVIDITSGGLEFLGGFLGAVIAALIYARFKKISIRLYLDILAPGVMWGLAFGRLGCFFNGCCFGGMCVAAATGQAAYPWAVEFPFASPAHYRQWEEREITVPAELITTSKRILEPGLVSGSLLTMPVDKREGPKAAYESLRRDYDYVQAQDPESKELSKIKQAMEAAKVKADKRGVELAALILAQRYPSRIDPTRRTSPFELEHLAGNMKSAPVHPTQLYASLHAILLSGLLSAIFYMRKRHGLVIGLVFVLYPIPRMLLEMIRVDNPQDVGGLTVSQFVGLAMLAGGLAYLLILYKKMPERSPLLD